MCVFFVYMCMTNQHPPTHPPPNHTTPPSKKMEKTDIVIPGIYVALLLRYDTYAHLHRHPYFASTMVSYVLGMGVTIWVMLVFKAAQPALLYLVPAILCASFGVAAVRGEVSKLLAWSEVGVWVCGCVHLLYIWGTCCTYLPYI